MGGRHSRPKPPIYPPCDPIFEEIGCSGFRQDDYMNPRKLLEKAPFLNFSFIAKDYDDMNAQIMKYIKGKTIYEPVYLFVALNNDRIEDPDPKNTDKENPRMIDNQFIEGYLYFPSMTKTGGVWSNYNFLAITHSWIYRILYNYQYRLEPYSSCGKHIWKNVDMGLINELKEYAKQKILKPPDEMANYMISTGRSGYAQSILRIYVNKSEAKSVLSQKINIAYGYGLQYGCSTLNFGQENQCLQSDGVHRGMGIYMDGYNYRGYPAVYFRTYRLNGNDVRLINNISKDKTKSFSRIQRNLLTSNVQIYNGCQYMLISNNMKYFMSVGESSFVLYYNPGGFDLSEACFKKKTPKGILPMHGKVFRNKTVSYLIIEDGNLNIYGYRNDDSEKFDLLIHSMKLMSDPDPVTLMLNDNGSLSVYDKSNKVGKVLNLDNNMNTKEYNTSGNEYNKNDDARDRMLNLLTYLRMSGMYRSVIVNTDSSSQISTDKPDNSGIGNYNSKEDYLIRFDNLVANYRSDANYDKYKLDNIDFYEREYRPSQNIDKSESPNSIAFTHLNATFGNNSGSYASSNLNDLKEETPEERARRLDKEANDRLDAYNKAQAERGNREDGIYSGEIKTYGSSSNIELNNLHDANGNPIYLINSKTYYGLSGTISNNNVYHNTNLPNEEYNKNANMNMRLNDLNEYFKYNYSQDKVLNPITFGIQQNTEVVPIDKSYVSDYNKSEEEMKKNMLNEYFIQRYRQIPDYDSKATQYPSSLSVSSNNINI
jgi:hypothetical protein